MFIQLLRPPVLERTRAWNCSMLIALMIDVALVGAIVLGLSQASALFGARRRFEGDKAMPYETGMPPMDAAVENMRVAYYKFAVLFVIFDVDLAFLAPWVLLRRGLTFDVMVSMTVFLFLVALTLAYVWRKGALKC